MDSSKGWAVPNEFEHFWRPFIRVFQVFCVSNYSISPLHIRNRFLKFIPLAYFMLFSSLHILPVLFAITKGLQSNEQHGLKYKENTLVYYVNFLSVVSTVVTHMTVHLEPLFAFEGEEELYEKFKKIDTVLVSKLGFVTNYKTRRTIYIRKTVGTIIMSVVLIVASTVSDTSDSNSDIKARLFNPVLIITIVITRSRWCYTALYLNMLADTLKDLHILLKQHQLQSFKKSKNHLEKSKTREKIRFLREIYTKTSRVATLVGEAFGWSLIALLIEVTFKAINACYWLYINQRFYGSYRLSFRKF